MVGGRPRTASTPSIPAGSSLPDRRSHPCDGRQRPSEGAGLHRSVGEVRTTMFVGWRYRRRWSCPSVPRRPRRPRDRGSLRWTRAAGDGATGSARAWGARRARGTRRRLAEDARPEPEEQIEPLVGVERAVLEDDLGARDHGPTTVFHIVSAEVLSVVHQTASPRPTSSKCSAWTRVAKADPWVCATSLRVPPTPLVETTNARSREAVSWVGTSTGRPWNSAWLRRRRDGAPARNPMRSIVGSNDRSAMTRTASVFDTTRSSSDDVVVGAHGRRLRRSSTCRGRLRASRRCSKRPRPTIAGAYPALAESDRPHRRTLRDLAEQAVLDDPLVAEEGERATLGIARQRLDDVAREVEAVGDLPAPVDERRTQGKLERRAGRLLRPRRLPMRRPFTA